MLIKSNEKSPQRNAVFILILMVFALFLILTQIFKNTFEEKIILDQAKKNLKLILLDKEKSLKDASFINLNQQIKQDITNLDKLFIEKEQIENIVEHLEYYAQKREITNLKNKIEAAQDNKKISFNLTFDAQFKDIYAFLKDIDFLPYALTIDYLKLEKKPAFNDQNFKSNLEIPDNNKKIKASIKITFYTQDFLK